MDYLRYFLNAVEYYKPVAPLLSATLKKISENKVVDLCSGGGGSIEQIYKELSVASGQNISFVISDKFPNVNAYKFLKAKTKGNIDFKDFAVDATDVPRELKGFRTMFSAVHHFYPETIKAILKNAIDNNAGIGLFDGGDKNIFTILGIMLFHPIAFLICTPFFKPFKFSRIFFTYIIPFIPLYTVWDGSVSILRLYSPEELLSIAKEIDNNSYIWESGKVKNKFGMSVTYLIGYPNNKSS
ncbi:MAG TPA: hypothetical protein VN026_02385 [Bacteroidia bacterium]|nr:hypothetical protein [Bacteroidia bacterium]